MIGRSLPIWLYMTLAIAGISLAFGLYAALSMRQTRINPTQTVMPGSKGFSDGFVRITEKQGRKDDKPSFLARDLSATYLRLSLGLIAGTIASVVLGIAMGAYSAVEAFCNPVISFMAKVPPTAMLAVYMVVFGTGMELFIALIGLGIFFTMVQSIYQAVKKDVPADLIDKAYTLGASEFEVITQVIWRQILPRVLDTIRVHIGPAMIFLIVVEWLFADAGFGYMIRMESRLVNMNVVYIYLAILGTTGLLLDLGLLYLRRWLCPWFGD